MTVRTFQSVLIGQEESLGLKGIPEGVRITFENAMTQIGQMTKSRVKVYHTHPTASFEGGEKTNNSRILHL